MKVFLVNDTSDDTNWGAQATSTALREMIFSVGGEISSVLYQYSISSPQEQDLEANYKNTVCNKWPLESVVDVAPKTLSDFNYCAQQVVDGLIFKNIKESLVNCDAVFINGEGCLFDKTRQSRMMFFIAFLAKQYFGKVTAVVNHSIVMNDPVLVEIAQYVYPMLDDVVFREPDSALACPGFKGKVAADAAYLYSPATYDHWVRDSDNTKNFKYLSNGNDIFDPEKPYVCVGGGSVYFRGLRVGFDPVPNFMTLCEKIYREVSQVVLTVSSERDRKLFEPVSKELGLPLVDISTPLQKAIDILGNARVYIGARWHPSIFSHAGGTPVVALSAFTPKMDSFIKQADMKASGFDPFRMDEQMGDILRQVKCYLNEGEAVRERLRVGAVRLKHQARDNVRVIAS